MVECQQGIGVASRVRMHAGECNTCAVDALEGCSDGLRDVKIALSGLCQYASDLLVHLICLIQYSEQLVGIMRMTS